jgi:hypothetical protein
MATPAHLINHLLRSKTNWLKIQEACMVLEEQPGKVRESQSAHTWAVAGVPGLPALPAGPGILPQA